MLSRADSSGNPGRGGLRDILARPRGLSSPHAMLTTDRLGGSAFCRLREAIRVAVADPEFKAAMDKLRTDKSV